MLNGSHVSLKFTKDLRETLLPFHNAYVYSVFLEYDTASEDKGSCFVAVLIVSQTYEGLQSGKPVAFSAEIA